MNRILPFFIAALFSFPSLAQSKLEWGAIVKEHSSQRGSQQFSAEQALGKPNVLPQGGDSPCAWAPSKPNSTKEEFIKVRFERPFFARQVIICESMNPGAIKKVYTYSTSGGEKLVWENKTPGHAGSKTRVLTVVFDEISKLKVQEVKVVLQPDAVDGFNAIDAIGISESETPFEVDILQVKAKFKSRQSLGENVNSAYTEYLPQISPDGQTLYFCRRDHPGNLGKSDDIWFSKKIGENTWTEAERMPAPLNDQYHNYVYNITPDGTSLLLGNIYNEGGPPDLGVSRSFKTVDGWSFPEGQEINGFYNEGPYNEFFLASNKKVMLMTMQHSNEGYGDNDIYVSFLNKDKSWSKPKNIGPIVNTAAAEASPFLAADMKTLFFGSQGFSGYGKGDIYVSKRLDDTWENWSEPVNMGPEINTDESELYYSIPASGKYAYFVSNKQTLGASDIFKVELPGEIKPQPVSMIKGKIINVKTKQVIQADIAYEILPEGVEVGIARTDPASGEYKIALPQDNMYSFHANLTNFIPISERIDLQKGDHSEYEEIEKTLFVVPLVMGTRMILKNVGFVRSKSELLDHSYPELNRLVELLDEYPNMEIRLEGHTDATGDKDLNLTLSQERADVIRQYLSEKGIREKRITTVGHGGDKPVAPNNTEANRAINRRVEYVITKL